MVHSLFIFFPSLLLFSPHHTVYEPSKLISTTSDLYSPPGLLVVVMVTIDATFKSQQPC